MGVPDFQSVMLPLLRLASDGQEHALRDAIDALANEFSLTEADRKELLPSGRQATFNNRVGWARTYLTKAGLIELPRRGHFRITPRGLEALKTNPPKINIAFLEQYPEFVEFRSRDKEPSTSGTDELQTDEQTPEESLETAYQKVRRGLATELLQTIKSCSPEFFEHLVVDVLLKMGYGGSRKEAGQAVGKSGDGGIDGIIKEDRLGLDIIYIQAKRWDTNNTVGRPEVQKFAGALQGHRAKKGIFITTSDFSREALDFVSRIDSNIVLIDGQSLAQHMIDHSVGVSTIASYEVKKIDSDYFLEP
jgi:restriction system protein